MKNQDNQLSKANKLRKGSSFFEKDTLGKKDRDDFYSLKLKTRSSFNLKLSDIRKRSNVDVELYALDKPLGKVRRSIGRQDFRGLSAREIKQNLTRIARSKKGRGKGESLNEELEKGTYFIRVLRRKGNTSYKLSVQTQKLTAPSNESENPTAAMPANQNLLTAGGNTFTVSVNYSDNVAIDVSSVDVGDIGVTGPQGNTLTITQVAIANSSDGTPRIVTYQVAAPNGTWDSADNGNYAVNLFANQIKDTSGNAAQSAFIGSFEVAIEPPKAVDTAPPVVTSVNAPDYTRNSKDRFNTYDFSVTYSDASGIDFSTLDDSDITVTGPNGVEREAKLLMVDSSSNGSPLTATYQIKSPRNVWQNTDNGEYTITLNTAEVNDTSGLSISGQELAKFQVDIESPSDRFSNTYAYDSEVILGKEIDLNATLDIALIGNDMDPREDFGLFENVGNAIYDQQFGASGLRKSYNLRSYRSRRDNMDVVVYDFGNDFRWNKQIVEFVVKPDLNGNQIIDPDDSLDSLAYLIGADLVETIVTGFNRA